MTQSPARGRARGPSLRLSVALAAMLGVAVVGSAWLKFHHLRALSQRVQWQPAGFSLQRPAFDRAAYEAWVQGAADTAAFGAPGWKPTAALQREFLSSMEAYLRADDRSALASLHRVLARQPHWAMARFYQGVSELFDGHPMTAALDLAKAREAGFAPPDGPCDWWLGIAYFYNGQQGEGRRCMATVAASSASQAEMARTILQHLDSSSP